MQSVNQFLFEVVVGVVAGLVVTALLWIGRRVLQILAPRLHEAAIIPDAPAHRVSKPAPSSADSPAQSETGYAEDATIYPDPPESKETRPGIGSLLFAGTLFSWIWALEIVGSFTGTEIEAWYGDPRLYLLLGISVAVFVWTWRRFFESGNILARQATDSFMTALFLGLMWPMITAVATGSVLVILLGMPKDTVASGWQSTFDKSWAIVLPVFGIALPLLTTLTKGKLRSALTITLSLPVVVPIPAVVLLTWLKR